MSSKNSVPLSTRISREHRSKLDQIKQSGFRITAVIEQGIDAAYKRLTQSGIIRSGSSERGNRCNDQNS